MGNEKIVTSKDASKIVLGSRILGKAKFLFLSLKFIQLFRTDLIICGASNKQCILIAGFFLLWKYVSPLEFFKRRVKHFLFITLLSDVITSTVNPTYSSMSITSTNDL